MATAGSAACWSLEEGSVFYFTLILLNGGASFGNAISLPPSMVADMIAALALFRFTRQDLDHAQRQVGRGRA